MLLPETLEHENQHQQTADHDALPQRRDADQHQPVLDHLDEDHAEQRSEQAADATADAGAAEDGGGDRLKGDVGADVDLDVAQAGDIEQRREASEESEQAVGDQLELARR